MGRSTQESSMPCKAYDIDGDDDDNDNICKSYDSMIIDLQ